MTTETPVTTANGSKTNMARDGATGTTTGRPLRRDAENNRRRIIKAAREVFATHGVSAGLNDIAHHAGVGVGTVYRRFPDKDQLIEAALQDQIETLIEVAEQGLAADTAWDGLTHVVRHSAAMHVASRGLRDVVFSTRHGQQQLNDLRQRIAPRVEKLIQRAQAEGAVRPDAGAVDIAMMLFMVTELARHSVGVVPDAYQRYVNFFLDALRPQAHDTDLGPAPTDDDTITIVNNWAQTAR